MKNKTLFSFVVMLLTMQVFAYKQESIDINVNGQSRNMICYTPSTSKSNMPLWIVTHGMNQNPEYQRDGDKLYELIDTAKFVVCYLRSDGNTWDIGGQKDLNFVRQTITEMKARYGIDTNRVYWSGFSMGSMLIYHGIENGMGDVIAAFAPCSGIKFGEPWNNCKKPVNLIHCHGKGDDVFPISQYDPRGYAMHFKDLDKCSTYKKTENYRPAGGYDPGTKEVWSGGTNGTEVEILLCENHGHWPSVNYTKETWNFCRRFSKLTPAQTYERACKEAATLLDQWKGDVEIFTALKTSYTKLATALTTYGKDAVDATDEAAVQNATAKLQAAIDNFTTTATTNTKTSKKVTPAGFNPNFHIYLCFGQSNMEGNATPELQDYAGSSERFLMMSPVTMATYKRSRGLWYVARPPLCRDWTGLTPADYFGKEMIKNLPDSITVGVINVSLGGCAIEMFNEDGIADYIKQQADWLQGYAKEYGNNPFRYLVNMAQKAQEVGVIKGILLHQGESNNSQPDWPQKVDLIYSRLLAELGLERDEVPLLVGEMLQKDQGGVCWGHNDVIATVPTAIANAHVVSSKDCPGASDGLHFTAEGYRRLGRNYAQVMYAAQQRLMENHTYSIHSMQTKDGDVTMLAGSSKPLYVMLTDQEGAVHDVTASCQFTCDQPGLLSFSKVGMKSGNAEGNAQVTATYTNAAGQQISTSFSVSVRFFPLFTGQFNPSMLKTGSLTTTKTVARFKSEKGGMGGWTYPGGVDLSDYKYLVVNLTGASAAKPAIRVYGENNTASAFYHEVSMTGQKQGVVDLQHMQDAEGNAIDPHKIYIVGITVQSTTGVNIADVCLTNDDPTSLADIISDGPSAQADRLYDLMGRPVSTPGTGGIYIRGGKKVILNTNR